MIPALAPLFTGPLAPYADALGLAPQDAGSEPATALLDPEMLNRRLDQFARRFTQPERRAVASLWAKHHFSNVLTPVIAANLMLGRDLPVALAETRLIADAGGATRTLILPHAGTPVSTGAERFRPLMEGHLRPLITAVAKTSGVGPKVLWSNFGNLFENIVHTATQMKLPAAQDGLALMAARRLPDGTANPLFEPIRRTAEGRTRRVCCVRYLMAELDYCTTCPLERP
ncbi:siderophore-iron reductase FhuF [Azorhizobium oxalatiphilum]|uniref:Siderophore-iron reductase FhuF n=1 Tax=Azorhizobium oxalatiphilum TaxID=980631 RepID=A0A917BWE4_9HYPH|nr:siderophore-iron reductase FhuF [Azorhizobium oxalatiphilum]GGF58279.1 siderophore-iron reductase FhuF [Azorhizobium oxalatiphilum]